MNWRAPALRLRGLFEGITGTRIFRDLPGGVDLGLDVERYLPNLRITTVFDVGANVGQSTASYRKWFPDARVIAFEPAPRPFAIVREAFAHDSHVEVLNVAMSSSVGSGRLFLQGRNDAGSSLNPDVVVGERPTETVELTTVDAFRTRREIEHINFLKIDTEGHDLDVLRGAVTSFNERRIDLVQVEAGMNRDNEIHVPFEEFKAFFEGYDYALFRMYEQVSERARREPHLRRTNLVFCSPAVIDANRRATR